MIERVLALSGHGDIVGSNQVAIQRHQVAALASSSRDPSREYPVVAIWQGDAQEAFSPGWRRRNPCRSDCILPWLMMREVAAVFDTISDLQARWHLGAIFGTARSDPAQILIEKILKLGPDLFVTGGAHIGDIVGDYLNIALLCMHAGCGGL